MFTQIWSLASRGNESESGDKHLQTHQDLNIKIVHCCFYHVYTVHKEAHKALRSESESETINHWLTQRSKSCDCREGGGGLIPTNIFWKI